MSSGDVDVPLPKISRSSSIGPSNVNSNCERDEGNANKSDSDKTITAKSKTTTDAGMSVYLGGGNIIIPKIASGVHRSKRNSNNTNNKVNNSNNELQVGKCCFFWTCCCRDTSLNRRHNQQDHSPKNHRIDNINGDNDPQPSTEDIRAWGDSFDSLMKYSVGRKSFGDFLKCEYSEENILFWSACEELKREKNPSAVEEKARLIYEDYISILSPKEVSLDSRVREIINRNMVDPTTRTFDEAQSQIYTLMHRDSYPRFINSSHYKKLAQLNNNGSGGGGTSNRRDSSSQ